MPRTENKTTPVIVNGILYSDDDASGTRIDTHDWFMWLEDGRTFSFEAITFAAQMRRQGYSWYAYKRRGGKLSKTYVGRCAALNLERLREVAAALLDVPPIISG